MYYLAQVFSSKTKTFKKYWKMEKILEKSRNFASPEKWTCLHVLSCSLYFVFTLQEIMLLFRQKSVTRNR